MAELVAQKREILGRKVKYLRADGIIPAELYGKGKENIHLSVSSDVFHSIYKEAGEHAIVNVAIEGGKTIPVLINDVSKDPITGDILSVDFYQVRMDEKTRAHVPIVFEGESLAANDLGGVLVKTMKEVEVEALPADIPDSIVVDLTSLTKLDTSIYIKDLLKSDSYSLTADADAAVVSVSSPREEEEEPVAELTPEDVVVEGEEKRADKQDDSEEQATGDENTPKDNS